MPGYLACCYVAAGGFVVNFVRNASAIEDQRLLRILDRSCRLMHVRRAVRLVLSSDVQTPALMGFWRPVILWPETGMPSSSREMRMLFCHELAHLKRHDIAVRWVMALTRHSAMDEPFVLVGKAKGL